MFKEDILGPPIPGMLSDLGTRLECMAGNLTSLDHIPVEGSSVASVLLDQKDTGSPDPTGPFLKQDQFSGH